MERTTATVSYIGLTLTQNLGGERTDTIILDDDQIAQLKKLLNTKEPEKSIILIPG